MGRDNEYPLSDLLLKNVSILIGKINILEGICPLKFKVTSGYRPGKYNLAAGGALKSSHVTCEAVDIADNRGLLKDWCLKNINKLSELGLFMEDPAKTPTWVHLQTRKTLQNPFKLK